MTAPFHLIFQHRLLLSPQGHRQSGSTPKPCKLVGKIAKKSAWGSILTARYSTRILESNVVECNYFITIGGGIVSIKEQGRTYFPYIAKGASLY
ncbi:hypothetical protein NXS19_001999 [Fusarium pseudograminearum]|nr:hypothetical protein NXS19_001999 [Fusarium pseudograminearum]